ncbi:hypothetical protein JCM3775_002732 [Rhodotorula graminis]
MHLPSRLSSRPTLAAHFSRIPAFADLLLDHVACSTSPPALCKATRDGRAGSRAVHEVVQPAAKTRKAASSHATMTSRVQKRQSKMRGVEKQDGEQESEGDEKDQQTPRSHTTRSRGAAEKKKVVVQSPHASAAEDVSPRKKGDKRVSNDIPPPRDLDADELKRVKEFEALKKPRSSEGAQKEKAVRSFSQLVSRDRIRTPPDEVMAEAEPLGRVGSEDRAAHIEGEDDLFDPGFFPDDLAHVPALDALAPGPPHAQDLLGVADHGNAPPHRREASPSPLLDPAKDETVVERAVPATKERPAILVPDRPPQAAAAAAKARAVTAPALSSPHPQRHPQQPQHPPPQGGAVPGEGGSGVETGQGGGHAASGATGTGEARDGAGAGASDAASSSGSARCGDAAGERETSTASTTTALAGCCRAACEVVDHLADVRRAHALPVRFLAMHFARSVCAEALRAHAGGGDSREGEDDDDPAAPASCAELAAVRSLADLPDDMGACVRACVLDRTCLDDALDGFSSTRRRSRSTSTRRSARRRSTSRSSPS